MSRTAAAAALADAAPRAYWLDDPARPVPLPSLRGPVEADLLVVGNVGLSTIAGRLLGSVPANVARRSKSDVLIVHTS